MQAMTRNPLADPGLLGLTAGANAALALAIVSHCPASTTTASCLPVSSGQLLVRHLSSASVLPEKAASPRSGSSSPDLRFPLSCMRSRKVSEFTLRLPRTFRSGRQAVSSGRRGDSCRPSRRSSSSVPSIALIFSRQLTILSLSEEVALGLGQNIIRIKAVLYVVVILLAGAAVALSRQHGLHRTDDPAYRPCHRRHRLPVYSADDCCIRSDVHAARRYNRPDAVCAVRNTGHCHRFDARTAVLFIDRP